MTMPSVRRFLPAALGLACGASTIYVDNVAFGGEVSPIVVVIMLLAAATAGAAIWGPRGWPVAATSWASVPGAHLVKHALGIPDTLHPNTYLSILYLALFTLCVSAAGVACGAAIGKLRGRA